MEAETSATHDPQKKASTSIEMEELTQVHQNQNPMYFLDLLYGESYFQICIPLHKAALEGNWEEANRIIVGFLTISPRSFTDVLCMAITEGHRTILHVATGAGQTTFVEKILRSVEQHDELLSLQDENNNTAFCIAAATGHVEIAELMLRRNADLPLVRGSQNRTPLYLAVLFGQRKMAKLLCHKTAASLNQGDLEDLFFESITSGLYDIALQLLADERHLNYALEVARDAYGETALHMLARKPSAFANRRTGLFERLSNSFPEVKFSCNTNSMTTQALQLVKSLTQKIIQRPERNVGKLILKEPLFVAAKLGNFEFLAELVRSYPDLVHNLDEANRTIFHVAILHRHVKIFSLIYEMGFDMKLLTTYEDNDGNNMLHLVARYPNPPPASNNPGAALELQRELLIFKEVEKIIPPANREKENSNGQKPKELFTMDHEGLRQSGEEWMKKTAKSCMLVAMLIATLVFTSVITVPGGNDGVSRRPVLFNNIMFKVFVMSVATALTSSCTSILMFLSILTSQYKEQDFLKLLPFKLTFGLLSLFMSVISMMVAFSSAIFLYDPYNHRPNWMAITSVLLVSIPIILYGQLEYPLLRDFLFNIWYSRNWIKAKANVE